MGCKNIVKMKGHMKNQITYKGDWDNVLIAHNVDEGVDGRGGWKEESIPASRVVW